MAFSFVAVPVAKLIFQRANAAEQWVVSLHFETGS
jgi:hypothetical protein